MAVNFSCSRQGARIESSGKEFYHFLGSKDEFDKFLRNRDDGEKRGDLLLADLAYKRAILHVARELERVSKRGYRRVQLWEWAQQHGQQRGWVNGDYYHYSNRVIIIL